MRPGWKAIPEHTHLWELILDSSQQHEPHHSSPWHINIISPKQTVLVLLGKTLGRSSWEISSGGAEAGLAQPMPGLTWGFSSQGDSSSAHHTVPPHSGIVTGEVPTASRTMACGPPPLLGGLEGWTEGWERNNQAGNHDTKHAFILFTKTAWIAKTLQTAFHFNDGERAGETGG